MLSHSVKKSLNNEPKGKISKDVKSYANDTFVIKKAKESKAFLEKHGFPEELLRKKQVYLMLQSP